MSPSHTKNSSRLTKTKTATKVIVAEIQNVNALDPLCDARITTKNHSCNSNCRAAPTTKTNRKAVRNATITMPRLAFTVLARGILPFSLSEWKTGFSVGQDFTLTHFCDRLPSEPSRIPFTQKRIIRLEFQLAARAQFSTRPRCDQHLHSREN